MVVLTSFPPPVEGVRQQQPNTAAHIRDQQLGNGTLFITESRVSWMGVAGQGFSLEYPSISLHAVSKDLSSFPHQCIYLMVDANLDEEEGKESDSEEEESTSQITEVRFVPDDSGTLDALYLAMCDCQALHPDPDDSISEEEGFFEDEEGEEHLSLAGQARLVHLENIFQAGLGEPALPGDEDEPQIGARATNGDAEPTDTEEAMETGQFEDADQ